MQIPATSAHTPPTQPAAGGLTAAPKKKADAAVQDFLDYAHMTPAQKMRASILKSMGMTEDDLKGMTPEDRQKIEQKIEEIIKKKVEEAAETKTGVVVDLKA